MSRVVLLLGAGASIEYGVPSTTELSKQVRKDVTGSEWARASRADKAFLAIESALKQYLNDREITFEQIYHCTHELINFFPPIPRSVDRYRPLLTPFLERKHELTKECLEVLEREMIQSIYRNISDSCDRSRSTESFSKFLDLLSSGNVLRVYTTNYDDLPLQAKPDLYTGFQKGGMTSFDRETFWEENWTSHSIFHLHGSVHFGFPHGDRYEIGEIGWFDDRNEARKHSTFSGSTDSDRRMDGCTSQRSALVTGLDKLSRIQTPPFSYYYSALSRDLLNCALIVIVGFGMRDLHINNWLQQARAKRRRPGILYVDDLTNGFEPVFDYTEKSSAMLHLLKMDMFESSKVEKLDHHLHVGEMSFAAIWDAGFVSLLQQGSDQIARLVQRLNST